MPSIKERINVYEITREGMGGTLYLDNLAGFDDMMGTPEDFIPNDTFKVRVINVDKEWFDNLPEFECFE